MKSLIRIIILLAFPIIVYSQNKEFNKDNIPDKKNLKIALASIDEANFFFEMNNYAGFSKALPLYLKANEINPDNCILNMKIGKCYLYSATKLKSLKFLEKAKQSDESNNLQIHFLLGRAYQLNYEWDKAINMYDEFIRNSLNPYSQIINKSQVKNIPDSALIKDARKRIIECNTGKELIKNPVKVKIENLGNIVNSKYAEYCPLITADESVMLFTSRRDNTTGGKKDQYIDDYYEDIYISEKKDSIWCKPVNVGDPINTNQHDATIGLSADGQILLVYKDDNGNGNIYKCELKGNTWSAPVKLNEKINSTFQEPSACLSYDSKSLYFVSDRPKGLGGKDIYISQLKGKQWATPKNIGKSINTEYDEDAVFIHPDGKTLYFSSRGHSTMGGYDIFKSIFENGNWSKPINLGYPINTPDDDIFFVISASGEHGYYSSIRPDGFGDKDIYMITFAQDSIKKEPQLTLLKGIVYDEKNNQPLEASIEIIDNKKNEIVAEFKSNSATGKYLVSLPSGVNYGINVNAVGYLFHSENIDIEKSKTYKEVNKDIPMKKVEIGKRIILNNIFFDYGKATLRDESLAELEQLLKLMTKTPSLKIEISGHTDNKGSENFNQDLSEQRAKAVVDYLITKGIDKSRMLYKGYGFKRPIASNNTEEGCQLNRRTEFEIIEK